MKCIKVLFLCGAAVLASSCAQAQPVPGYPNPLTVQPTVAGQCAIWRTSGQIYLVSGPCNGGSGGAVSSVFGRTGDVVSAANDYDFSQLSGRLMLNQMAIQAADTVVMNASGGFATPTAVALVSCSGASNALTYNTTTHAWGCNTISGGGGGAVDSVFGRTGTVVSATNDYNFNQIAGSVALTQLAPQAADTFIGNATGSSAVPTAVSMPACANDGTHALVYVSHVLTCATISGGGGGSVSVTAASASILINPSPGTNTFTVANTNALREVTTTTDTITSTDVTKLVSENNASNIAVTVNQASGSLASGAALNLFNYGAGGIATYTPTISTIAGKTSEKLYAHQGASLFSNGAGNYEWILGLPQVAADGLLINTSASVDFPIPTTLPSCSSASNALTYNTSTHALGCNTINGRSSSGSLGDIQANDGSSGFAASHLNDNGTIIISTESINTKTNAIFWEIPNASSTGTTLNKIAKFTGAPSTAVIATTSDTVGIIGVVAGGAGTTGSAQIAIAGQVSCVFDGATTAGHFVIVSTTVSGDCHDTASVDPAAVAIIGNVLSTNGSGGTYPIMLYAPSVLNLGSHGNPGLSGAGTSPNVACWSSSSALGNCADQNFAYLDTTQSWTKAQRGTPVALTISTATFTPNFDNAQNFEITLIHASCPCTLANPSTTVVAGQTGTIKVIQSATGNDAIATFGSLYYFPGGVSTIAFSTGASQYDIFSYQVDIAGHINLTPPALNFSH